MWVQDEQCMVVIIIVPDALNMILQISRNDNDGDDDVMAMLDAVCLFIWLQFIMLSSSPEKDTMD